MIAHNRIQTAWYITRNTRVIYTLYTMPYKIVRMTTTTTGRTTHDNGDNRPYRLAAQTVAIPFDAEVLT